MPVSGGSVSRPDARTLAEIKADIERLTAPERLRLAAGFIEHGKFDLALALAEPIVNELKYAELVRARDGGLAAMDALVKARQ